MEDKLITCYQCGNVGEPCDMPDLFYQDFNNNEEMDKQYKLQQELVSLGYNLVTCGNCGAVIIEKLTLDK